MRHVIVAVLGTAVVSLGLAAASGQVPAATKASAATKAPETKVPGTKVTGAKVQVAAPVPQTTPQAPTPAGPKPVATAPASAPRAGAPRSAALHPAASHAAGLPTSVEQTAMVKQYCATCHSERGKAGGLSLAGFDAAVLDDKSETVEKMIRKLRTGMMPPAGARRPEPAQLAALTLSLESTMDKAAALEPNPGWRPFQRMNRAEYTRAVKSLLALDVDINPYLPSDTISQGFDNVADVQSFSPTLMEGYMRAASQISRLAVGDREATATAHTYKLGRTMSQMRQVEGAPVGTRGGLSVVHVFPADGDYVFDMMLHNEPLGGLYGQSTLGYMKGPEQIDVSLNGERVALITLETRMKEGEGAGLNVRTPPIHVKAGPQRVSAAFVERFVGPMDDLMAPVENTLVDVSIGLGITVLPHLRDFSVIGPSSVTGVSETPSRSRIFNCRPTSAADEQSCARDIVRRIATQAFRGLATPEDVTGLMTFYEQGRQKSDFEGGIRYALQAILASPRFIFRFEQAPGLMNASGSYRLNDRDLAARLSFFLWGTVPDAELMKVAAQGTLKTPLVLDKQVRRMLQDPRAEALSTRFARQWLRLQDLDKIIPDYLFYPNYDDSLAQALKKETELFFASIVREDRSVIDLLTADYSYVNGRVAQHYGIPNIVGNEFQRVSLPPERRGILGQGSILVLTSNADRTSPVQRGKWIMEVLLGSPPPAPPPNVPALEDTAGAQGGKLLSVRARMEEHRKNPACTSCHRTIDPLGLALENFDPTGAWRIKDNEVPVDSMGELYDGTKMDGAGGLRQALVKHQDAVLLSFTESLMTYALGRRVETYDMSTVRGILRDAARSDNRFSSFILGVVKSPAFRMSRGGAVEATNAAAEDKR